MSQVKKLQDGGKVTPKNLQEYNNQKAKLEEEKRKKELEAESNSIVIDGRKYDRSEARRKLSSWRNDQQAIELRQSYGRRGRNVDSDYNRFLDMIDRGDVKSIDFKTDGGFRVKYAHDEGNEFNPSDKYSSGYLANAIRNNLLNLSEPTVNVGEVSKIDLDYNPKNMLLETIWGNKFRQDTYENMSELQRTADVARTLKENRGKFVDYFTDNSAFNVLNGSIPFKSLDEYDRFINDLESLDDDLYEKDVSGNFKLDDKGNKILNKNKSTWSFAEQLRNRRFGSEWADYIFGENQSQNNTKVIPEVSPEDVKITQEQKLRKELGLPEDAPLTIALGSNKYNISKEGLRDSNTNELFTGYLWLEPYGIKNHPYLKQGYHNEGVYVGGREDAEKLAQVNPKFRTAFYGLLEDQKSKFEGFDILESKGTGKYEFLNYLRSHFPDIFPEDARFRAEEITSYVDRSGIRNNNAFVNLYDPDYNPEELYQRPRYTIRVNSKGDPTLGIIKYDDNGFQVFEDSEGNREILKTGTSNTSYPVNHTYRDLIDRYLYKEKPTYSFGNNKSRYNNPYSTQTGMGMRVFKKGGDIQKLQAGGNIYSGSSVKDKKIATTKDLVGGDWGNLSAADKADLAALGLDIAGLVSTAAVGVGNAVGAASGLGSTAATIYSNAKRGDMSVGTQIGMGALNLAMDAATLVPGLGSWAKGAKTIKTLKRVAPVLKGIFAAMGAGQAGYALNKAISNEEMTIDDWRILASGLTALTSLGRQAYTKQKYTQKVSGKSEPITVSAGNKDYEIKLSSSEVRNYNSLNKKGKIQVLKDKVKGINPNIPKEELDAITLNKKELFSPNTWVGTNKAKVDKSTIRRELKPEVVENLVNNKYNWYTKGLLEERAIFKPGEFENVIGNKYFEINPNTLGFIKSKRNIIGRPKIGEGSTHKRVTDQSRLLGTSEAPSTVGKVDFVKRRNVEKPRTSPESTPYKSEAETKGKYETIRKASAQSQEEYYEDLVEKGTKHQIELRQKIEADRKREIRSRNIKAGKERAAKIKAEEAKRAKLEAKERRLKEYEKIVNYNKNKKEKAEIAVEKEELAKLGAKEKRDRLRQKEYQNIVNYNKQQKEKAQKITEKESAKKEERKTRHSAKKEAKGTKKTSKDIVVKKGLGGVLKLAYGGPVTLPFSGDDYADSLTAPLGRSLKGGINVDTGISTPRTNYSPTSRSSVLGNLNTGSTSKVDNQFDADLNKIQNGSQMSMPLSTISSVASLISKNKANDKIFNLLKKQLKPVVLDTPQDINYNIQGNEGIRNSYYKQAANLSQLSNLNQTTDIDRQLAYNLSIAKAAAEARLQGDLANEQTIAQSREKAFQVNASNLARREQVANQNRASITDMVNKKAYLEAQKIAQNAQNKDIFLHDVTEQLKQRSGEKQQYNTQNQLLNEQKSDFNNITSERNDELRIQKAMDKLMMEGKVNTPEYNTYKNQLLDIQRKNFLRNLKYQNIQNNGLLRQTW